MPYWVQLMNKCFVPNDNSDKAKKLIVIYDDFYKKNYHYLQSFFSCYRSILWKLIKIIFLPEKVNINQKIGRKLSRKMRKWCRSTLKILNFFQFGLKEEDEIDFTDDESDIINKIKNLTKLE